MLSERAGQPCRDQKDKLQKELTSAQGQLDKFGEARAAHVQGLREEVAAVEKRHAEKLEEVHEEIVSLQQQLRDAEARQHSELEGRQSESAKQITGLEQERDEAQTKVTQAWSHTLACIWQVALHY